MTYVLSDIHGNLEAWNDILNKINFSASDTLYVLGDVIDRNPHGIEILQQIMHTPNIHMLLGNHEYMMLDAINRPYRNENSHVILKAKVWRETNGGEVTWESFCKLTNKEQSEIIDYLSNLPLNIEVEVNNLKFMLCHAAPEYVYDIMFSDTDTPEEERGSFCVWERSALQLIMVDGLYDGIVIFGHTPTIHFEDKNKDLEMVVFYKGNDCIKAYDIDCGAAYHGRDDFHGRLCCLCLETLEATYSD